ncbi:hypothetical protein X975_20727, partial [Stegodyphus mimosarum]
MVSILILICFGFVAMLFPSKIMQLIYACVGALIFSMEELFMLENNLVKSVVKPTLLKMIT